MLNKIQKLKWIPVLLCSLLFIGCGENSNNIEPQEVLKLPETVNANTLEDTLKATPSSKEKNKKSGIFADNYDSYEFAGYNGKLSFFYNEDGSLLYYKWFYNETDKKKASTVYKQVCSALTGSYGDGEESNNANSDLYTTNWETEQEQITAQKISNENGYEISYMVVSK